MSRQGTYAVSSSFRLITSTENFAQFPFSFQVPSTKHEWVELYAMFSIHLPNAIRMRTEPLFSVGKANDIIHLIAIVGANQHENYNGFSTFFRWNLIVRQHQGRAHTSHIICRIVHFDGGITMPQ